MQSIDEIGNKRAVTAAVRHKHKRIAKTLLQGRADLQPGLLFAVVFADGALKWQAHAHRGSHFGRSRLEGRRLGFARRCNARLLNDVFQRVCEMQRLCIEGLILDGIDAMRVRARGNVVNHAQAGFKRNDLFGKDLQLQIRGHCKLLARDGDNVNIVLLG